MHKQKNEAANGHITTHDIFINQTRLILEEELTEKENPKQEQAQGE